MRDWGGRWVGKEMGLGREGQGFRKGYGLGMKISLVDGYRLGREMGYGAEMGWGREMGLGRNVGWG